MNRGKALAYNTFIISIGTFLPKLTAFVTLPIVTAGLTKTEYGTYDLIVTVVSLLLPVVTLQIQAAAFRFLVDCRESLEETKSIITTIYFFAIPVTLLSVLVFYCCLGRLATITRILISLFALVDILMLITQQIVRGLSYNKLYSASAVIQSLVNMLLVIWTIRYKSLGLNGALLSITVATALGMVYLWVRSKIWDYISINYYSKKMLVALLSYSWPMIPNALSLWVLSISDRVVLSAFVGLETVAVYSAANKIPQLFTSVLGTFVLAWQENASLSLKEGDVDNYYSYIFDKIFGIFVGSMSLLIAATPILFKLLIRGDYSDSYPQMPFLFMGLFFSTISSFMGGIYVAHKRTKSVGITTMIAAGINLLIDLVLVKYIGIYAASISTLASYAFLALYRMIDVRHFQYIEYKYTKIIMCLVALIGMCIICQKNTAQLNIINLIFGVTLALCLNKEMILMTFKTIDNQKNKK